MSEDNSNLDRDYNKRTKKRGGGPGGTTTDYKQNKRGPNKDYQVYYDPKGYDRPPKDQSAGPNKGNYNSNYEDYGNRPPRNDRNDKYDRNDKNYQNDRNDRNQDYDSRPYRKDNYGPYKPQGQSRPRPKGPDQGGNFWRKKATKIARDTVLETYARIGAHSQIKEWATNYSELFIKERQPPVNDEVFQLDPNDGLMAKTNRGPPGGGPHKESDNITDTAPVATTTNPNKGMEMFDFAQERPDPIQGIYLLDHYLFLFSCYLRYSNLFTFLFFVLYLISF